MLYLFHKRKSLIGMTLLREGLLKYVIGLLDWEKTTSGMLIFCTTKSTVEKKTH